jgi:transcriptional regulator with XRE-family HTH domain
MSFTSIDLGLRELLRDPKRRQEFFKAITQDEIASQIRSLRKKRELNQTEFARAADMKQSAVSRIEQAEYSSWTLTTLFKVAAALDARWRVVLEPVEDAIAELEQIERETASPFEGAAASDFLKEQSRAQTESLRKTAKTAASEDRNSAITESRQTDWSNENIRH